MMNDIQINLAQGKGGILVGQDFKSAFDTLNDTEMLNAFREAGIKDKSYVWLKEWLTRNRYACRIDKALSEVKEITSGCVRGPF